MFSGVFLFVFSFSHQPLTDDSQHILLFFGSKLPSLGDSMPFLQAPPAAASCGVLGYEYGMVLHGGLFAVIGNLGGKEAGLKEFLGMFHNGIQPFLLKIRQLPPAEVEAASEL